MDETIREEDQPVSEHSEDDKKLDETIKEEEVTSQQNDDSNTNEMVKEEQKPVTEQNDDSNTKDTVKEEQPITDQNNDNETLDIVSDEYIAKRKKKRIIAYSSISFVALLLSVAIVVLACIKIDIKPNFLKDLKDNQITYTVYLESREPTFNLYKTNEEKTNKEYEEFGNLMDDVFKVPLLTAIFTGRLGGYEINKEITGEDGKRLKFYSSSTTISSSLRDMLNTSYIRVKFEKPVKLIDKDGNEVKSKYDNSKESQALTFDELYFSIYNTNQEHEVSLYLATVYDTATITEVKVKFNTYKLYKFAENF